MTAPQFKEGQRLELTAHRRQIARLQRGLVLVSLLAALAAVAGGVAFFSARNAIGQTTRERSQNVERNCADVNWRHDQAVRTVDRILDPRLRGAGRAERARLEASRETTVLIIEALTPKRDCVALARRQVKKNP